VRGADGEGDRGVAGWRVRSELPLPGAPPWTGDERAPDVTITEGAVPSALPGGVDAGPLLQVAPDGTARYEIASVAAYLVRDGREVVVDRRRGVADADVRVFLLGTVLAVLCYQRGIVPLHGSCIEVDGRAVAIVGPTGAGTSTLAAAARQAGLRVLGDEVTVLRPDGDRVLAVPTVPELALWPDVLASVGVAPGALGPRRAGIARGTLPVPDAFCAAPRPVAGVVHLGVVSDERSRAPRPLRGLAALAWLHANLHTPGYPAARVETAALMGRLPPLLAAVDHHVVLPWYPSWPGPAALLEAVVDQVGGGDD